MRSTSTSPPPAAVALGERLAAGQLHGSGGHPGHARRRGGAGGADVRRRAGLEDDVLGPELAARDLEDHVGHALADLGGGAVHGRAPVLAQHDARRAVVVEALRVTDVLEADREADAALHALAARRVPGAAGEPDGLARQLLGLGLRERGRAADDLPRRQRARQHLAGRQRGARLERVQDPQLDRVDVERGRELVHLRLGREARLHRAEPAHRAAGRVVRVHARPLDQDVVDRVRAGRERAGVRDDRGRARGVRAAVEQDPHADVDELPLLRRAVLGPDPRRVAMDVADERLLAAVDHLHGPPRVEREHRRVHLDREVLATAERAADAGEVDPHLLRLEREAGRDLVAVDVQPLGRDVDVDAALAVRDRDPRLRAEEGLVLLAELVVAGDDDVSGRVGVAAPHRELADDVRLRALGRHRGARRASRRGAAPISVARSGSTTGSSGSYSTSTAAAARLRLLRLLRRDDRDRLAEVAHAVDREHGLVGKLEPVDLLARDVLVREDGVDARHRERLGDVDGDDARVRVRAAHGLPPEQVRRLEVARVLELAQDLRDRVLAARRRSRDAAPERPRPGLRLRRRAHLCAHLAAATWTASRIFA